MQPCLLIYDIPDNSEIANPSGALRPIAIRINLSCWLIQEGDIPYPLLHHLQENGATWHVVRFDANENEKLINMAIQSIKSDIRATIGRAHRSAANIQEEMESSGVALHDAIQTQRRKAAQVVRRLREHLAELRTAGLRFGIPSAELGIQDGFTRVNALQTSMRLRAAEYVRTVHTLQERLGSSDPIVKAGKRGIIPGPILADAMDDCGEDGGSIRSLFDSI